MMGPSSEPADPAPRSNRMDSDAGDAGDAPGAVDRGEADAVVAAATAGDEAAFAELVHRHRRELHVHCYRMLANFDEAEDVVQETFLRAWRRRATFDGSSLFRAWLYRIATNACLDALRRRSREQTDVASFAELPWLQPYPDRLLDEIAPTADEPDALVVARETVELTFLAAMQALPPQQRAVLLARDVLGLTAQETATMMETSVAAANSALQRARATLQAKMPEQRQDWATTELTAEDKIVLAKFIDAHERNDAAASIAIARSDIRITMPPHPMVFEGIDVIAPFLERAFGENLDGDWRLVPTRANRVPTAASYLRPWGVTEFRAFKFDVIRVVDGAIAEITTFGPELFPAFGLPEVLPVPADEG
jgi:RNA polymerase sigma-70 factor (ECF subfamily)